MANGSKKLVLRLASKIEDRPVKERIGLSRET